MAPAVKASLMADHERLEEIQVQVTGAPIAGGGWMGCVRRQGTTILSNKGDCAVF